MTRWLSAEHMLPPLSSGGALAVQAPAGGATMRAAGYGTGQLICGHLHRKSATKVTLPLSVNV